ncbi:PorV/PorQ family protein [bacterium]|nr:PorV/PorQ family protein [bacterium]NUN45874.1 PorV/PorQ family protein [bacterium]
MIILRRYLYIPTSYLIWMQWMVFSITTAAALYAGDNGGRAGSFLRLGLGPRARAMGDAYTALADNVYAPYYNPAGLPLIVQPEVAVSTGILSFDRQFTSAGFAKFLPPKAGFGINVLRSGFGESDVRDADGNATGEHIEDTQYTVMFGFALRFSEKFSAGIAPQWIHSRIYDVTASSVGLNVGALYQYSPVWSFGISLKNLLQKLQYSRNATGLGDETTVDKLPATLRLGVAHHHSLNENFSLVASYDLEKTSGYTLAHHFGAEIGWQNKFFLRTGLDQYDWTAGLGIPFDTFGEKLIVDYTVILDGRNGISTVSHDMGLYVRF